MNSNMSTKNRLVMGTSQQHLSSLGVVALVLVLSCMTGCQTLPPPQSYPPPPEMGSTSTSAPANEPGTILRGQNGGGYSLPPMLDVAPDGGRHQREPLPVSGQVETKPPATNTSGVSPQESTASTPAGPATTVAQKPQGSDPQGNLLPPTRVPTTNPPQSTIAQGPSNPPSTFPPAEPLAPPPVAYGVSPSGPMSTYGTQPPGYELMPELSVDQLYNEGAAGGMAPYVPRTRTADIYVNGYPARTGRLMFGGAVNSDAGVTGQFTVEERNFDITRFPTSFQDLTSGTAFRGAGQTFRLEAVPGNRFKRYTVNFVQPYLFNYMPISMSVSGFLFDRIYRDWDEERLGGRLSFGYRITPDLSLSLGLRGEQVDLSDPRVLTVPELNDALGTSELYSGQVQLSHDTRNSPFAPSEGHYFEASYEQAFGDYDFGRTELSYNRYFLLHQRPDRSGRQTLTAGLNVGFTGEDTPIFENFFAGGFSTLRGFEFRGASPTVNDVQVGGRFKFIGTFEYMFPLTADDMFRGVAFVDYGTVEREIEINKENFRVAPGFGLRIAVPALGPAPLAFDFAFPIEDALGDQRQTFSFSMGLNRRL